MSKKQIKNNSKVEIVRKSKLSKRLSNMFKFMCIAMLVLAFLHLINTIFFQKADTKVNLANAELVQLDALENNIEEGTPIAIITTSLGEIRAVLYPDEAPNIVQSFIELAESGYYDNTYIFRVQENTYFAGGSYDKEGNLNADTLVEENETIQNELSDNLWPFKGSFCALSAKSGCSGSRFIVNNSIEFTDEIKQELLSIYTSTNEDGNQIEDDTRLADAFIKYGGIPNFSQQMTIFAQTYQGFDVIDKICSQQVEDEDTLIPTSDILIEKIEISTYSKEDSNLGDSNSTSKE